MRTAQVTILSLLGLAAVASAGPAEGWHRTLKDGAAAARKSGKPILVVTAWSDGL